MLLPGESADTMKDANVARRLLTDWIHPDDYSIERSAVYTFHGLIAERWRNQRVLLAGDAAHQTPPFLGQGMCAGIRDAANLAWKLERVVNRLSDETLLDTYEGERKPHALKVIEAAIRIGQVVCDLDLERASQRNQKLIEGDQDARGKLAFALPRLEQGALVSDSGGALFPQLSVDGQLTDEILGPGFTVLVRSEAHLSTSLRNLAASLPAQILIADELGLPAFERAVASRPIALIRPDRYLSGTFNSADEIFEDLALPSLCPSLYGATPERAAI